MAKIAVEYNHICLYMMLIITSLGSGSGKQSGLKPVVGFLNTSLTVSEGQSFNACVIVLDGGSNMAFRVQMISIPLSASVGDGGDVQQIITTIEFKEGSRAGDIECVPVIVFQDSIDESSEMFALAIQPIVGVIGPSLASERSILFITIINVREDDNATTLATYNAGLFGPIIGSFDIRTSILISQIIDSDVEILCLQEIWSPQIQRRIRRELAQIYPHVLSAIDLDSEPGGSDTPACSIQNAGEYLVCMDQNCPGVSGGEIIICTLIRCFSEFTSLPEPCQLCLAVSEPGSTTCLTTTEADWEKTYGLMLLSKKELLNSSVNSFNNQSLFRGYLTASVKGVGDLICTHLSGVFFPIYVGPPFTSPLLYSSYSEQQLAEVTTLLNLFAESGFDVPILLGDFNHSPARTDGVVADFPFHYGLMNAGGFISPYVLSDGRCTFCTDNPLTAGYPNVIIDHIYITTDTTERVIFAERFLDDVFFSPEFPLSDHFGVKVRLSDIRRNCNSTELSQFHCVSEIQQISPFQPNTEEFCNFSQL